MPEATPLPSVTIHYAQTVDGRIATASGESRWISGDETLVFAHQLRASHDAILVGVGTVLRDNPRLTVRLVEGGAPLRVVVDSDLRTPAQAMVLADGAAAGTLLVATERAPRERVLALQAMGAQVMVARSDAAGRVDLRDLLAQLAARGVRSLLVEGGAGVITSFLREGLVDRLAICIAPKVLGLGIEGVGDLGLTRLAQAIPLHSVTMQHVGADFVLDARLRPEGNDEEVPAPETARAVWFPAPRAVEIRTERLPALGAGDARVRAEVSAISHGTEMLVYRGQVAPELALDLPTLAGGFAFPIKYGYASVGTVTAVGSALSDLRPGQRVFALHPHQSEYVIPGHLLWPLPAGLSAVAGAFAANVETALNVMLDAPLRLGERALVFGQGVVGLLLCQLLRRAGAGEVIVVDPFPRRRALALSLGADVALAPAEATAERLRDLTAGRGADVAYEASGSPAALQAAIEAVSRQGLVVAVSWYGRRPVSLDLGGHFHRGRLRIVSSQVGAVDPALAPRWDHARRRQVVRDLLAELRLEELVSHRFPLERAPEAYRLLDEHPEETVQVLFEY